MTLQPNESRYTDAQRQAAADWFVIIHSEEVPNQDTLQSWLRWMDQHDGNRLAFEAIAQAWHGTTDAAVFSMPSAYEVEADDYDGEQSVQEWLASQSKKQIPHLIDTPRARTAFATRRWVRFAAAAVVTICIGVVAMIRYQSASDQTRDAFSTQNGEQMEITLADGSKVWLGPKSTLQVAFTGKQRLLQLATGEAFFSVKKDRTRPFIVRSTSGDITAVGTAFNVRATDDHATVSVSEGVVTVTYRAPLQVTQAEPVRVASGQQLTFAARSVATAATMTESVAPGERARWRDGVLVYRNEPLRDVVLDVARYADKQLEVADAGLDDLRFSGVVYEGAIDEWIMALPESFPVKVVSEGHREIISAR